MSTQRQKFELFTRLQKLGFTYDESQALRRIEMTLHRWAEAECGDSNDYASTSIERDEDTGKPFRVFWPHSAPKASRYPIADREAGALKRLDAIVRARNSREVMHDHFVNGQPVPNPEQSNFLLFYHQSDPRGCSLYLITREQLGDSPIDSVYNRGLAVCI